MIIFVTDGAGFIGSTLVEIIAAGEKLFGYATDEYLKAVGIPEPPEQADNEMIPGLFPVLPEFR